jgi:cysteine desulfurase/selenocysteine lyase
VIGLGASIDFINSLNLKKVFKHEKELHDYMLNKLLTFNDINIYGNSQNKGAIISFNFHNIHANDLAIILDQKNVAIRTGHHCAQPLMKYFNIVSSARISFGVYNDKKDVDLFVDSLKQAKEFLS